MKDAHRPILLWVLIGLFIIILSLWLWQGATYPHTIYEYIQTDEFVTQYEDRVGGFAVDAVAIWDPHNPWWVDVIRQIAPLYLFLSPWFILAIEFQFREKRRKFIKAPQSIP